MKTVKAICAASVIALFLSLPVCAETPPGDIHVPGRPTPPNPITGGVITPAPDPGNTGLVGGTQDNDLSFSDLTDMLWYLAWML
jgi:hypothetical protein